MTMETTSAPRQIYVPTAADRELFERDFEDFLPKRIIDIHAHLAHPDHMRPPTAERLERYWVLRIPVAQTVENFLKAYEELFPRRQVTALVFAMPIQESDLARQNEYLLAQAAAHRQIRPLYVTRPEDDEATLERAMEAGFLGFKPYPDLVTSDHPGDERLTEFLTPELCKVADRHGAVVMVHIAKFQRFADKENCCDLIEITGKYPSMRIIVAHLGRSYNPIYLEKGLEHLGGVCNWWYDFSAVTNPEVHRLALASIPHERILFGTDLPIMLARGFYDFPTVDKYVAHIEGINLEPAGHPPLVYQILSGFRQAALDLKLSRESIGKIFYDNAKNLLGL